MAWKAELIQSGGSKSTSKNYRKFVSRLGHRGDAGDASPHHISLEIIAKNIFYCK